MALAKAVSAPATPMIGRPPAISSQLNPTNRLRDAARTVFAGPRLNWCCLVGAELDQHGRFLVLGVPFDDPHLADLPASADRHAQHPRPVRRRRPRPKPTARRRRLGDHGLQGRQTRQHQARAGAGIVHGAIALVLGGVGVAIADDWFCGLDDDLNEIDKP
jgi:hypothetical protein